MNIIVNEVGFYIRYSIYYIAWPIRFYAAAFLSAFEASVTTDSIWYSSERAATNDLKFLNLVRSLGWCWPACFDNTSRRLNALEFWQQSGNGWVCINSFASADISAWDSIWRINILLNTSTWRLVGKSWIFPSTDCFGGDRGCVDDGVVSNNNFNKEDRFYFFPANGQCQENEYFSAEFGGAAAAVDQMTSSKIFTVRFGISFPGSLACTIVALGGPLASWLDITLARSPATPLTVRPSLPLSSIDVNLRQVLHADWLTG